MASPRCRKRCRSARSRGRMKRKNETVEVSNKRNGANIVANAKVYIETSVIGYLTARPSRDLIVAACQEATREWWASQSKRFDLYASVIVIREAGQGARAEARKRIAIPGAHTSPGP